MHGLTVSFGLVVHGGSGGERWTCRLFNTLSRVGAVALKLDQFVKDCSQYVFARPNPIERNCGIDADYAQNCQMTNRMISE
jgi:hypothetical protein